MYLRITKLGNKNIKIKRLTKSQKIKNRNKKLGNGEEENSDNLYNENIGKYIKQSEKNNFLRNIKYVYLQDKNN